MKQIRDAKPKRVILMASWFSYSEPDGQYSLIDDFGGKGNHRVFSPALRRTIQMLSPHVGTIVLIGPTPGAPSDAPYRLAMSRLKSLSLPADISTDEFEQRAAWFWNTAGQYRSDSKVIVVNPMPWFCDRQTCRYASESGELFYRDGGHLSLAGARFVARMFPSEALELKGPLVRAAHDKH